MAGPNDGNLPYSISVNYGTISVSSGETNSAGTSSITYKAPAVKVMTLVSMHITDGNTTYTKSFYVLPSVVSKPVKTNNDIYYVAIGALAAIAAIFIGLYLIDRKKLKVNK
jgi:hypothetical protein